MKVSELYSYAPKSKMKAGDANPNGKYQFYASSPDENRRCDSYIYDATAIIMGTGGGATLHYFDGKFSTSADCLTIIPNKKILPKYLYYFFLGNFDTLEAGFKGAGLKHTNKGYIDNIEISSIPSLDQQSKIIRLFDDLSSVINQRQQQLHQLDTLIKARFVEMFENVDSYPIRPLSGIAEYWNGLTYKPADVVSDGMIVLRSSNIQNMQLDLHDIVRVKYEIGNKKTVKKNDILMCSRNGSARLVGKVALIPESEETMSFGAFMMVVRSDYYSYLMAYFQMPAFRTQISTGTTTINQITRYMLDKVSLPVPDKTVIEEFSSFVSQVDKSKFTPLSATSYGTYNIICTICGSFVRHRSTRKLWYNNNMDKKVIVSSETAELIYSNRIYCYDDERINMKIKLTDKKEDELKLGFLFKYSSGQEYKINMQTSTETGIVFELTNFNSPFGIGLKKPMPIAKLNGQNIFIIFNVYKNGESNPILDLSLYLEDKNEQ